MAKKKDSGQKEQAAKVKGFIENIQREAVVPLTEHDVNERITLMENRRQEKLDILKQRAEASRQITQAKEKAKAQTALHNELTEEINRQQDEIDKLIEAVSHREERRCVECLRQHDFEGNRIIVTAVETGEMLSDEPIKKGERQTMLNFRVSCARQSARGYIDENKRHIFANDIASGGQSWGMGFLNDVGVLISYSESRYPSEAKCQQALEKLADKNGWQYYGPEAASAAEQVPDAPAD